MKTYDVLVSAEQRLYDLVQALTAADLSRPTPCARWDVRALLSHTLTGIEIFASSIDGQPAPTASDMFGGDDRLNGDPIAAAKQAITRSQAAFATITDPTIRVETILGPLSAGRVMAVTSFATTVHGWDIAIAAGQQITELPFEVVAHARTVAEDLVPPLLRAGSDLFQAPVPAPANATPTQSLMAYLGRSPAWTQSADRRPELVPVAPVQ